jgi:hypothetical protein
MGFLRRLLGGKDDSAAPSPDPGPASDDEAPEPELDADEAERLHERAVLRAEAERLDPLRQRQLRYAEHAWTPPTQGGERRADDEAAEGG